MGDTTIRKALNDYKSIYMAYRNFAERTRVEYQNDLRDFSDYVGRSGIERVGRLGIPIIQRYVAQLEEKGYSSLTRKRKVVVIRSLLSFLYQDGQINTNIAEKVVLPFADSPTPHILTNAECSRLRKVCADSPRDAAIIELLLQTGIRLSELTRLTLNDLDFEGGGETSATAAVRILAGRGKKDRLILLNTQACLALSIYLRYRGEARGSILFLNRFGEPIGERGVQKMLGKHLKKAGIGRASIHTLRHTFGAYHIARGSSLKTVQEVVGHKDIRTTHLYQSLARDLTRKELLEYAS